jgi:dipeptidyl aminopeptidase/acylaminoacyl peptidase
LLLAAGAGFAEDYPYRKPPAEIVAALNAAPTPSISVSPQGDYAILMQAVRYPDLADVARPMQRLAGMRIDERANGLRFAASFVSFTIKRLPGGEDVPVSIPRGGRYGSFVWSPDGTQFAFTNTVADGIELWIGSPATGQTRSFPGVRVNGARVGGGSAIEWMGDNRTLLVSAIPAGRGPAPARPELPRGPRVEESAGAGPAPTYQDLLASAHDEALFDHYVTSQLVFVDSVSNKAAPFGKPAVFTVIRPSPDQEHLLVGMLRKPYSYQLPAALFPTDVEVWDRSARVEFQLASLPLADRIPLAGVRTGPRSYQWIQEKPATLVWAEALDAGDPRAKAPFRDRIRTLAAPFRETPRQVFQTRERFQSLQPLPSGKALVWDYERVSRTVRTLEIDLAKADSEARVLFSLNENDAYRNPGQPVLKTTADGRRQVIQVGDEILLTGQGASPTGDHPFLDRFNVATGRNTRLFESGWDAYEYVVAVLNDEGSRLLTRRENPQSPPNYFIRTGAELKALTQFPNPYPPAASVKKQTVSYTRADGLPLSFVLYLPADYKPGTKLPALLWAYPYEFSSADTAAQVTGHATQDFTELTYHQLFALHGYALLDYASMPIVGDADTVNNTYVQQLKMNAQAAVDKAVELGVVDRERIGVFGHSYGAFMTANLLAHTDLFRAAVAESGAYNRTLTPFGFQAERRSFWEAPDIYTAMSPFWRADKIKTPLLLIHGEDDDNTGTYPIQSERMYAAVRGNGGTARLVMLPAEAHTYRGRESIEHVLYEEISWFDKYLK